MSMRREAFTKLLGAMVAKSGISKSELAARLEISPAAISQCLHGVTLPSEDHFFAMLAILQVPKGIAGKLSRLLDLARLEPKRGRRSLFARNLLAMRLQRGMTHEALAEYTGLTPLKLRQLETDESGVIDGRDRIPLREFFGCDPEEFSNPDTSGGSLAVAENDDFGAPLIALDDLIDYRREENLLEFADRHFRDFLFRDFSAFRKPVAVRCGTAALGGTKGGVVEMILCADPPETFPLADLCRYACGEFRLKQRRDTQYLTWLTRLNDHKSEEPELLLPVLEIALRPARNAEDIFL